MKESSTTHFFFLYRESHLFNMIVLSAILFFPQLICKSLSRDIDSTVQILKIGASG